jgi:tetratricopeptide (TPR) repeat protein
MSKLHGPEDQETADALNYLGFLLYQDMGEYAKAKPFLQEALRIHQKVLGLEHPDTENGLDNLAGLYRDIGEYAKAEPLFQEASRIDQKVLGLDSRPGWSCRRRRNTN